MLGKNLSETITRRKEMGLSEVKSKTKFLKCGVKFHRFRENTPYMKIMDNKISSTRMRRAVDDSAPEFKESYNTSDRIHPNRIENFAQSD